MTLAIFKSLEVIIHKTPFRLCCKTDNQKDEVLITILLWNYLKLSHFQAIHIVIIWSKIQIPNQGCKWIYYLLPVTIQQLLLQIFRFWSFLQLIVTCLTTPWPQHVKLYATLFLLRLESIFRYIPYQFNCFYIVTAVQHLFRDIFPFNCFL